MLIRQEVQKDHEEIYNLTLEAFGTAEHTDGKEQDIFYLQKRWWVVMKCLF